MSAIAYLLLPATGVLVFLLSYDIRARFHGLQAITFGTAWALALYGASLVQTRVTQAVFLVGGLVWVVLFLTAAAGRDPRLPFVGGYLFRIADARGLRPTPPPGDAVDESESEVPTR